jgi:hypothetical protein
LIAKGDVMGQHELLPFAEVVEQVRQLCAQGRTGTAFIVSADNRMAQIHIKGGSIVKLLWRGRRGDEALLVMRTLHQASLRFDEGYVAEDAPDAGSTADILAFLAGDGPPAARAPREPAAPAACAALAPEVQATFERIMLKYIGPMAQIVCADCFAQSSDPRTLARALAGEIPSQEQAARFRSEVARALGLGMS